MPLHPRHDRAAASCRDWIAAAATAALLCVPAARAEEFLSATASSTEGPAVGHQASRAPLLLFAILRNGSRNAGR
jgi:hypothetical protein